jgi:hypothetical protein
MRYLTLAEVLELHRLVVSTTGGSAGVKRVGHAAMETFLSLNGWEIEAGVDEQERLMLAVASGSLNHAGLTIWLREHTTGGIS